jgi:vacuolar-type H+-ATPase subunit D/Vma8
MEILISETTTSENIAGCNVTFINRNKKKTINDADFFPEGSEVDVKIKQLKKLLKNYFDAQA